MPSRNAVRARLEGDEPIRKRIQVNDNFDQTGACDCNDDLEVGVVREQRRKDHLPRTGSDTRPRASST